jgi:hypothetical protein
MEALAGYKFSASTPKKIISFLTAQNFLIFDKTPCTKEDEFYLV